MLSCFIYGFLLIFTAVRLDHYPPYNLLPLSLAMLKSMTAYGHAILSHSLGRFVCELQSVNKRFLDIQLYLPKGFTCFQRELTQQIASRVQRGQVTVTLSLNAQNTSPVRVRPNLVLAKELKEAWDHIGQALDLPREQPFQMEWIAQAKDLFSYEEHLEDPQAYQAAFQQVLSQGLDDFCQMKDEEGQALSKDIEARLYRLEDQLAWVEEKAKNASLPYRKRLLERLEEVLPGCQHEERILREVALFAEKVDVTEEVTRFRLHLKKFQDLLHETASSGKLLEFLLQEMHREINTVASKSADGELSYVAVEMKGELEKIREQIQNVE